MKPPSLSDVAFGAKFDTCPSGLFYSVQGQHFGRPSDFTPGCLRGRGPDQVALLLGTDAWKMLNVKS